MELGLKDRVALITGASKGIGRAVALELATEGCRLAICARGADELEKVRLMAEGKGVRCLARRADVTDPKEVNAFVKDVEGTFGALDILVNNAGGALPGRFEQVNDEGLIHDYEVKILSQVRFVRATLHLLEKSRAPRVININALAGRVAMPQLFATSTHRAACLALNKTLAIELGHKGVLVNSVNIGSVITPQWENIRNRLAPNMSMEEFTASRSRDIPLGRFGTPEEVSGLIAFLASDRAAYITGASIDMAGGFGMHV